MTRPRNYYSLWLLVIHLSATPCGAFVTQSKTAHDTRLHQSSFSKESPSSSSSNSVDSMRSDIEAMKLEARRRLEALTTDLEEFKISKTTGTETSRSTTTNYLGKEASSVSLDSMEGDYLGASSVASDMSTIQDASKAEKKEDSKITNTSGDLSPTSVIMHQPVDVHLLENTRVSCL